jgi:hypothetical protein
VESLAGIRIHFASSVLLEGQNNVKCPLVDPTRNGAMLELC